MVCRDVLVTIIEKSMLWVLCSSVLQSKVVSITLKILTATRLSRGANWGQNPKTQVDLGYAATVSRCIGSTMQMERAVVGINQFQGLQLVDNGSPESGESDQEGRRRCRKICPTHHAPYPYIQGKRLIGII
jgi:hypothetical protein